jgi:hypothetical protein
MHNSHTYPLHVECRLVDDRYYKPITCEFDGVGDKMDLAKKIAEFVAKV